MTEVYQKSSRMDSYIHKYVFRLPSLLLSVVKLCQQKKAAVRICVVSKNRAAPHVTYTNKFSQKHSVLILTFETWE